MILIFKLSSQTAAESSVTSGGFTQMLFSALSGKFRALSPEQQATIISACSFWIRKAAHFTIYALLGALAFLTVSGYPKLSFRLKGIWSLLMAVLYAATDELHQGLVSGRSCELRDILIDSIGAGIGIAVLLLIARKRQKRKMKAETEAQPDAEGT